MNFTRLVLRRPVTTVMIILALVIAGLFAYPRLPVRQLPSVHFPFVQVITTDPGADPVDVERTITVPIENAVETVNGIQNLTAVSMPGQSQVAIQFTGSTNVATAANAVSQAIARIAGRLPAGTPPPSVVQANPNAQPILTIALSGRPTPAQLYNLAQNVVAPALTAVPGVANVLISGGQPQQVNVLLHPRRLAAYGISLSTVQGAIVANNLSAAAGTLTQGGIAYVARTQGYFTSPAALGDLQIAAAPAGAPSAGGTAQGSGKRGTATASPSSAFGGPVYLKDVATVSAGPAPLSSIASLNGKNAVGIAVTAQSGSNSLAVVRGITVGLKRLRSSLPPGTRLTVTGNATIYTHEALASVRQDMILAIILAGLSLLLFLRRVLDTLIVLLAIPTSLIATFLVMYFLGFSLDLISLMALSLVIGFLVDDSIVVLENIDRHLHLGEEPKAAALKGRTEIGLAAVAITLTDVVVYAPMAFVTGNIGQIFREFGLTITIATLFSLFISFTLTPLLASRWLRPPAPSPRRTLWRRFGDGFEAAYHALAGGYGRVLGAALGRRLWVVSLAALSLAATLAFLPLGLIGTAFVPPENTGVLQIAAQMPPGTSLTGTAAAVGQLVTALRHVPGVMQVFATTGYAPGSAGIQAPQDAQLTVDLVPATAVPAGGKGRRKGKGGHRRSGRRAGGRRKRAALPRGSPLFVAARARRLAHRIPGLTIQTTVPNPLVLSGGSAITVIVSGPDPTILDHLAVGLATRMARLSGAVEVRSTAQTAAPEVAVAVNRPLAEAAGISTASLARTVQAAVSGVQAGFFRPSIGQVEEPIMLQLASPSGTASLAALSALPLSTSRGMVLLGQVASLQETVSPVAITQVNRQLAVDVNANVAGRPLGTVTAEVQHLLAGFSLPPGYTAQIGGVAQQQSQAFGPLIQSLLLSILLVYMLMAALYESFLQPFAVMLAVPLATVGAFLALFLTGNTLNIYSLIGMIMLMGLVTKNAILLVDYTNTLRKQGHPRREALLLAGPTRLRPILMTTVTMVLAMLPLALHIGPGASQRAPMAVVVIGGLITSTLLTLLVVPAMYTYVDDLQAALGRGRGAAVDTGPTIAPGG